MGKRRLLTAAGLAVALAAGGWAWHASAEAETPECGNVCPSGTRSADISTVELVEQGGFVVTTAGCEASCIPEISCKLPFVPAVTVDGFNCVPLEGFGSTPPAEEVDFSWTAGYGAECPPRWTLVAQAPAEVRPEWLLGADIDGDKRGDIVALLNVEEELVGGGDIDHYQLRAWLGGANSVVEGPSLLETFAWPLIAGDFDGDGRDEVIVLTTDNPDVEQAELVGWAVAQLEGESWSVGEILEPVCDEPDFELGPWRFAVIDMDGDGRDDLVHVPDDKCASEQPLQVWLGQADGSLSKLETPLPPGTDVHDRRILLAGEIDGLASGEALVVAEDGFLIARVLDGAITFEAVASEGLEHNDVLALGDATGDGLADLWTTATSYDNEGNPSETVFALHAGDGAGGFAAPQQLAVPGCDLRAMGAFEAAGTPAIHCDIHDAVVAGMALLIFRDDGVLVSESSRETGLADKRGIVAVDVDGDGVDEMAGWSHASGAFVVLGAP